ncbi:MAG: hypothetical protein A2X49_02775 [Lentisphaerae bacterium GWF2_52_8]|nr:MAG: hypothetical protein A2X49_02775 [Lentisphaerae bacterium GWF2_52_8]
MSTLMANRTLKFSLLASAIAFVSVFFLCAEESALDIETLKAIPDLPLKPEEITGLVATAESRARSTLTFESGHYRINIPKKPKDAEKFKEKYAKKGVMPINICMEVYEKKPKAAKKERLMKGAGIILILDMANKKLVEKKKMDLAKLCPT